MNAIARRLTPWYASASFLVVAASAHAASTAEAVFKANHPCPTTGLTQGSCRGYVIDRIIPRVCGGAEDPDNMRWLTLAEAKAKARWERVGCRPGRKLVLPGESTSSTEAFALKEPPPPPEIQALPLGATSPPTSSPASASSPPDASTAPADAPEDPESPHE